MATTTTVSQTQTLPRLLAINKDFTGLDEQIEQASHIIGLPQDWATIQEEEKRAEIIRRLVRARAEWVLRWILDKLKDEADAGLQARGSARAWRLLDWMVQVLPTSRSAAQLRDANFLSILERTLQENFEKDGAIQPVSTSDEANDLSESSETVQEGSKPSRKRKRTSRTSTPSKRLALRSDGMRSLFEGIVNVVRSITDRANLHKTSDEAVHTEHMKMALRTDSAHAARILKGWFIAVNKLLEEASTPDNILPDSLLDLSLILEIWEIRTIDNDDPSGASADQFSTECLIPSLTLYTQLQDEASQVGLGESVTRSALQAVERVLARHLLAPSRSAYFAAVAAPIEDKDEPATSKTEALASNLGPLRAKILQAAQIQDASLPMPSFFMSLFSSIPQLLDITVRMSPSRTPKARVTERPWIQAVFVALAECAGCPLEAPEFPVPEASVEAVKDSLKVLSLHEVRIDTGVLADLFWFHSGAQFPLNQKKQVHWSLIGALIELNPDTFVSRASTTTNSEERPTDLAKYLFDLISATTLDEARPLDADEMDIDSGKKADLHTTQESATHDTILSTVVIPILSSFVRNRDLLGFVHHWDAQLCAIAPAAQDALTERTPSIWEDRRLGLELSNYLEQSLTQTQIMNLFQAHADRVLPASPETEANTKAFSSSILLHALLWSINADETIASLEPQLRSLLSSYTDMVQDERHRARTDQASSWITLCRLLVLLWPLRLHASLESQKELLLPLMTQASKDVSATRKNEDEHRLNSKSRASALLFTLTLCDHLRTVPDWDDVIRENLRKALKALSPSCLEPTELSQMMEIFCIEFVPLLEYLEADSRKESLLKLLTKISDLDQEAARHIVGGLSQSLFTSASYPVRDDYSAAVLEALDQVDEHKSLRATAEIAALQIRPSALSRERREATLDKMANILTTKPEHAELLLSVMNSLQHTPNSTAKICSEGSTFFNIAQSLHENKCESPSIMQLFQELVRQTLGHMLPNKDQAQNKLYLEKFQSKLTSLLQKMNRCSPARLAILRAVFQVQKDTEFIPGPTYLALLTACLYDPSVSGGAILAAFIELPVEDHGYTFIAAQGTVGAWLNSKTDLKLLCSDSISFDSTVLFDSEDPMYNWTQVHALIAKFKLYPDLQWFIDLSTKLLRQVGTAPGQQEHQGRILKAFGNALSPLSVETQLSLIPSLTQEGSDQDHSASYRLLHVLVSHLDDKLDDNATNKKQQLNLLPTACHLLGQASTTPSFCALMDTIDTLIRDKHSFTSQHSIESALSALVKLSSRNSPNLPPTDARAIFARLSDTARAILLLHRGRLGGRFHLVLPLLQTLLFCLFTPHAGRRNTLPAWLQCATAHLAPANGSQYARLLSTLCSPTQSSVSKSHQTHRAGSNAAASNLNDPVKAAREYASHYVYPLLASFCRFQLSGRLEAGVREKVMAGVWEVVGTAGLDQDGLEGMFAGLDRSSRDIWRGVWEEWKKGHGRGRGV